MNQLGYLFMHAIEQESIGLCICIEALNNIVNHSLIELREVRRFPGEYEVYFHDSVHRELFLLRVLDFVKESSDKGLTGVKGSCLDVLEKACDSACFNRHDSVEKLKTAIRSLSGWMNHRSPMTFWLPDLDINANLNVSRLELLHISGNYSKHNLSRLTGVSKFIHQMLTDSGHEVSLESIPFTIDYFCEHLNDNYFVYYCSWLTELLNNLRWAIYDYLCLAFLEFGVRKSEFHFTYRFPTEIDNETKKKWFWGAMNGVLQKPYVKRFKAAHYLKGQSSLEWVENC